MPIVQHNPPELFPPYRCYTHATEIRGGSRLLIISGLNGYLQDGRTMPESRDGRLRHPRFLGLREDKAPEEVVRE